MRFASGMNTVWLVGLAAAIVSTAAAAIADGPASEAPVTLWAPDKTLPKAADLAPLEGVRFEVIQPLAPEIDGYRWLHGVALAWHDDKLYASFGHNRGSENSAGEEARLRISRDAGRTWGDVTTIESGTKELGISHGVFLAHKAALWAFHGAFFDKRERVHTRAYALNASTGAWEPRGEVVSGGFWPLQEPIKMSDGNWLMSGAKVVKRPRPHLSPPAVAISRGDDLTRWDMVEIGLHESISGDVWGESTVIVDGPWILNIARYGDEAVALVAESADYGRTWTKARRSNLPMATSKPYAGTLSTGQHYLIGTTTADSRKRRSPLTIAVTRPGEKRFSQVFRIRDAEHDGGGESHPSARLSYPYAIERDGHLYVAFSNSGSRGGNRNSAELAVIPIRSLAVP